MYGTGMVLNSFFIQPHTRQGSWTPPEGVREVDLASLSSIYKVKEKSVAYTPSCKS